LEKTKFVLRFSKELRLYSAFLANQRSAGSVSFDTLGFKAYNLGSNESAERHV